MDNINNQEEQKRKRKLIVLLFLVILLLASGMTAYFLKDRFFTEPRVISGLPELETGLEVMSDEQMLKFMQSEVDKDKININLKHEISVSKETNVAQLAVKNKPTNAYSIQVEYLLKEGNEQLYKSGLIPTNRQLSEVKLKKSLSEGSHEVMIIYTIFDEEKQINQSTIDGVLYVS
ncbi:hypothetical protein [Enterococcus thailandicus]|uniref:Uncharacterized protein n=1 Tax=Enterococcus thailandicus TaxID=417368 RepID=A0A179EU63_ENTTH|nr:hypothetical protein [Enterococcus thailandicus]ASZ07662.1 hypothetical protein CK496_06970 [Enterococcus thailandicus]MDK4350991.1 hypothetical protein [Enterococcus thailandicus]MDT2733355.1 hypothetical protein [Enterococcus thailandicus]MDT2750647.1 hypothetical protein [Enterococcus thailandicus]MDT2775206.1 hypothetical protein [Enterococcus thailandicus]